MHERRRARSQLRLVRDSTADGCDPHSDVEHRLQLALNSNQHHGPLGSGILFSRCVPSRLPRAASVTASVTGVSDATQKPRQILQ